MNVFVHLRDKTIRSIPFDDGHAFTAVRIEDGQGNDAVVAINADSATTALVLADVIRAAAFKYLPHEPVKPRPEEATPCAAS